MVAEAEIGAKTEPRIEQGHKNREEIEIVSTRLKRIEYASSIVIGVYGNNGISLYFQRSLIGELSKKARNISPHFQ